MPSNCTLVYQSSQSGARESVPPNHILAGTSLHSLQPRKQTTHPRAYVPRVVGSPLSLPLGTGSHRVGAELLGGPNSLFSPSFSPIERRCGFVNIELPGTLLSVSPMCHVWLRRRRFPPHQGAHPPRPCLSQNREIPPSYSLLSSGSRFVDWRLMSVFADEAPEGTSSTLLASRPRRLISARGRLQTQVDDWIGSEPI